MSQLKVQEPYILGLVVASIVVAFALGAYITIRLANITSADVHDGTSQDQNEYITHNCTLINNSIQCYPY